jgi:hypothetical protein
MTRTKKVLLTCNQYEDGIRMKHNKTHFEQVPLELVKQIAHEDSQNESGTESAQVTPQSAEHRPDWKELCKAIIAEEDPRRFTQLAEQLDKVLEERSKPSAS